MQLLEGHLLLLGEGVAAADDDHGDAVDEGVGDAGDDVGDARAGRDDGNARAAGGAGPGVGHVAGGLLVARVDDADAVVPAGLKDGVDVPAVEGEDVLHPLPLQHPGERLTAVDLHCRLLPVCWAEIA